MHLEQLIQKTECIFALFDASTSFIRESGRIFWLLRSSSNFIANVDILSFLFET